LKSFEKPINQWREIERKLKGPLDEIDGHLDQFGDIEIRLLDGVRRLGQIGLGSPLDLLFSKEDTYSTPVPQTEALDVTVRHALGHSKSGHRAMRQRITEEYERMELSSELLKEMHRSVLGADIFGAGRFRDNPSYFPEFDADGNWVASRLTIPAKDIPVYLDRMHARLHALQDSNAVHPILPIAGYAFDLFLIHPFQDGNGRLTRLALLLLLYKSGYHIGRYISIEGAINMRRLEYLIAIVKTRDGWIAARHDLLPWFTFVVKLIRDAYREFSDRTDALELATGHLTKTAQAIGTMSPRFTTSELVTCLPDVPRTLLRIILNRMRRQGKLQVASSNAEVVWRRVNENG